MLAWLAKSGLLAVVAPMLEVFLKSLGSTFNESQRAKRAEQTSRNLGRAEAQVDQGKDTIAAQQSELEAQANAPRTVDDAIARLEEGSA